MLYREHMSLRAGLYLRVSVAERGKDTDATSRTISDQERDERADAQRDGATIVAVYTDDGASASRYRRRERKDYARMVADIEAGELDIVYARESSRLQRDLEVYARLRNLCRANKVLWAHNGRVYDLDRKGDRMASAFEAIQSEEEAEDTRERVVRGVKTNAEAGRPRGRVVYGYKRTYDRETGRLIGQKLDPAEAEVVAEAARRVLDGETATAVSKDLNARGIRTRRGKEWDASRVKKMLLSPTYAGLRVHEGKEYRGTWPPIITEDQHARLVGILTHPGRGTRRDSAAVHLLSKIAVCGECQTPVRVEQGRYPAYACPQGYHAYRNQARVDAYVLAFLFHRLSRTDAGELFARDDEAARKAGEAREEAAALRSRLEAAYTAVAEDQLSLEGAKAIEDRLKPKIEDADERSRPVHLPDALRNLIQSTPEAVEAVWEGLSVPQRREALRRFVRVEILPAGKGGRLKPVSETVRVR